MRGRRSAGRGIGAEPGGRGCRRSGRGRAWTCPDAERPRPARVRTCRRRAARCAPCRRARAGAGTRQAPPGGALAPAGPGRRPPSLLRLRAARTRGGQQREYAVRPARSLRTSTFIDGGGVSNRAGAQHRGEDRRSRSRAPRRRRRPWRSRRPRRSRPRAGSACRPRSSSGCSISSSAVAQDGALERRDPVHRPVLRRGARCGRRAPRALSAVACAQRARERAGVAARSTPARPRASSRPRRRPRTDSRAGRRRSRVRAARRSRREPPRLRRCALKHATCTSPSACRP